MTVATLPLSNILSCSSLSSSRPSSSPAMIHVFPPQDLSGTMSNPSPDSSSPIPHISCTSVITICRLRHLRSFPVADVGGAIQRRPPDAVSERHAAFLTTRSRVLKASHSPSSCPRHSTASLVLQPPSALVCFSSKPLPRYARKQKCTRQSGLCRVSFHLSRLHSSFPFPSHSGIAEPNMQALSPVTVFGRSLPRTKRCVIGHSHNHVNRIGGKGYVCPSAAFATGEMIQSSIHSNSSISFLPLCRLFSFRSSVAIYKYNRVLTLSPSPTFAGPLRSCFVKRHCSSFSRPRVRLGAVAEPAENPASCPSIRRSLLHVPRRIHMLLDRSPDVYRVTDTNRLLRFDFQTGWALTIPVPSFTRPRCTK